MSTQIYFKYRPLPPWVRVMPSKIHGDGIICISPIEEGTLLGLTHVVFDGVEIVDSDGLFRTPLGGFINHSDTPNCVLEKSEGFLTLYYLKTTKSIEIGEELTIDYTVNKQCGHNVERL